MIPPGTWLQRCASRLLPADVVARLLTPTVADRDLAQTTAAGYADTLSPSLASVANAMHPTIRRDLAERLQKRRSQQRALGNIVVYMRLKGHVPPSTARTRAAGK